MSFKISYAQNREDYLIDAFFPNVKKGFYVDIGANDPNLDSVTKIFYTKGWQGINVEPLKSKYNLLKAKRPRDINLNIGIADKDGTLKFREYKGHGLSTFSELMQNEHSNRLNDNVSEFQEYQVKVSTLNDVLTKHKIEHIHFMKVDVEGVEYEVLKGNDWTKYRPELICIEADHIKNDWRPYLAKQKYTEVFHDGLNVYYLRHESMDRLKTFSYPNQFLTGPQLIKWTVKEEFDIITKNYENAISSLKASIVTQDQAYKELNNRYNVLHKQYQESQRAKNLLKGLVKKVLRK